ncbi:DUF4168 domain-containing protein [Gammaproteobacteria bacterium AB-CW1]|uniref:DUF4168 domain-containing protein n=1 Tax=Natronospira elongata TaxID=3110268 RepID=A0AAP6JDP2_9GAMM|nr:DUF4168 domain-containing protein [Gammaproteobacteria bacterium AB-CW1]
MSQPRYTLLATLILGLATSPYALAQDAGQAGQQAPDITPEEEGAGDLPEVDIDVDDGELERFVEAYEAIAAIRRDTAERVQQADDSDEATRLHKEGHDKKLSAIEEAGLVLEDYNEILGAKRADPETRDRFMSMLAEYRSDAH